MAPIITPRGNGEAPHAPSVCVLRCSRFTQQYQTARTRRAGEAMQPPPPPPEPAAGRRASSSSSSTCSTAAPRRSTTVGCMAGLLRLFSPYHRSHHRKRLTVTAKSNAAKQQPPPSPSPAAPSTPKKKKLAEASSSPLHVFLSPVKPKPAQQPPAAAVTRRRRSCDTPRSPTIAPEHRRRASCDSPRPSPPAIVARLMGLEESAPPSPAARPVVLPTRPPPPPPAPQPETAAEKRRKLLGALEKCDEDLKTLRRIIAAVRAAEMRAAAASEAVVAPPVTAAATTTPPGMNKSAANKWVLGGCDEQSPPPQQHKPGAGEQYPSPDSVLDNAIVSSPRFPCRKRSSPCSTDHDAGSKPGNGAVVPSSAAGTATKVVKPSRTFVFSGDYCKIKPGGDELHSAAGDVYNHHPAAPPVVGTEASRTLFRPKLPRAAGAESWRHHRRRWELEAAAAGRVISRAMAESAGEAMWGQQQGTDEQRRECGMVAAALERAIMHDLVCDVVADLLPRSGIVNSAGCRKRLCF